jgi:hypothetical protein
MVAGASAGNSRADATTLSGNIFDEAMRGYDVGFFDDESIRVECASNPFEVKVLPMSLV